MAYLVKENEFASFDLINCDTGKVIAHGSHPQDMRDLAFVLAVGEPGFSPLNKSLEVVSLSEYCRSLLVDAVR